ncbi:MAG: extracellular solute-binding protein [Chloroflexota bacterium]|nr:extracellular solute-binding protein [Chloroflexota bacterium]
MATSITRVTRRRVIGGLAGAGLAGTGLSRASASFGAPNVLSSRSQDTAVTSFLNWEAMEGTPTEAAVLAYQEQSGNTVEIIPTPGTGTDYETKVRTMLAGGTIPDVIRVNDDFVRFYSTKDQFTDLQPWIERDGIDPTEFYEPIWNFSRQPDDTYTAWSLGAQPRLMYYNIDMFEEAGVPLPPKDWVAEGWTWDDFIETAKALTVEGERWGALVFDDTGCEQTFSVNNGLAEGIYSEDGQTFLLAEPQGYDAIQWLADLSLVHKVQPERGLVTEANSGNGLFLQGRVGMIFRTQGTMAYFRNNGIDFNWDVASPPANVDHKSEASLICYAIPTNAQNPEGGWELLKFLGGQAGSQIFAETGNFIPSYEASAEAIQAVEGTPPANLGLFAEAMAHGTTVNFTEFTENARNVYRPQLDLVWNGDSTAEEVLTGVKDEIEEILSGAF